MYESHLIVLNLKTFISYFNLIPSPNRSYDQQIDDYDVGDQQIDDYDVGDQQIDDYDVGDIVILLVQSDQNRPKSLF